MDLIKKDKNLYQRMKKKKMMMTIAKMVRKEKIKG